MTEIHPFKPYIPEKTKKLIIGTIPPERFSKNELFKDDVNFYYGSRDNSFWELLKVIFDVDFLKINNIEEIEKRKKFLATNKIGICDILLETSRKNGSSLDKALNVFKYLDIVEILNNNPSIDTLVYTSAEGGVKSFMTKYLKEKYAKEVCHKTVNKKERTYQLKINDKVYNIVILYSPSPTALRSLGENGAIKRLNQWKEVFTK
jgi:G:T/U-mismatch repair DNA glycosylase